MREAIIFRRRGRRDFFVQLEGCPGTVQVCCSSIEVEDRDKFLDLIDATSPLKADGLVRVSITVGFYCCKKRVFMDCVIHKVLAKGEILEEPWLPEEIIPIQPKALVAPVRRTNPRWSSGMSSAAHNLLSMNV